ncbi:MAG: cupin domain-containing protein [Kiloniellaceae bacterium]
MSDLITTFEQLLAPVGESAFLAEHYHRRPLHVRGGPDKFAFAMSWDALNEMLGMDVWDGNTLQLVLDRQRVPPAAYSRNTLNRNQRQVLQPESDKVMELLRRGASLVLNNIETLHPGALAVAETIAGRLGAKVSANLYCSWQERQAFDSHYDRHDVYALHVVGEKRWRLYEGRMDNPVEHAAFYNVPQAECDRLKGRVAEEVVMRPGDLLYLPRGQFHDALASSEASIHLTFGCSEPTGLDWLTRFWERAVHDPRFRADLPLADTPEGERALRAHLEMLVERVGRIALDEAGLAAAKALREGFGLKRSVFNLPDLAGSGRVQT